MTHEELIKLINVSFGPSWWIGSDAEVWRSGNVVIKACEVSEDRWRNLRLLSRQIGPFSPILEIRSVGWRINNLNERLVVGLIVQRYIKMTHQRQSDIHFRTQPYGRKFPPTTWVGGADIWYQGDVGYTNCVEDVWVDIARIEPFKNHRAWFRKNLKLPKPIVA